MPTARIWDFRRTGGQSYSRPAARTSDEPRAEVVEQTVIGQVKLRAEFKFLKSVPGIGQILALTIVLETGDIRRFASVGNFASYCRCIGVRS
jgi:transposase